MQTAFAAVREPWWRIPHPHRRIPPQHFHGTSLDPRMYRVAADGSVRLLPAVRAEKEMRRTRSLRREGRRLRRERREEAAGAR